MYAYVKNTRNGFWRCQILRNGAWLTEMPFSTEKQARAWGKRYIADFLAGAL
jgi:hypothetical protein